MLDGQARPRLEESGEGDSRTGGGTSAVVRTERIEHAEHPVRAARAGRTR
ncbi:hypothetical protein ABZV34_28420 [Streptomyces sp. NPDC005195]